MLRDTVNAHQLAAWEPAENEPEHALSTCGESEPSSDMPPLGKLASTSHSRLIPFKSLDTGLLKVRLK